MARRKAKFVEEVEDINLIPIMNLVLCLIPLVLFKTQLVKVGMINVSAPKVGPASSKKQEEDPDKKPLGLTVALSKDGFILKATGADLSTILGLEGEAQQGVKIPKKTDTFVEKNGDEVKETTFDYVTLYNKLLKLRQMFEDDKLLTLNADPDMPFKYVIRTMDVIRYQLADDITLTDISSLSEAVANGKFKSEGEAEAGSKVTYAALWDQVTLAIAQ
jgi:biopolymer transport protein ExbD